MLAGIFVKQVPDLPPPPSPQQVNRLCEALMLGLEKQNPRAVARH